MRSLVGRNKKNEMINSIRATFELGDAASDLDPQAGLRDAWGHLCRRNEWRGLLLDAADTDLQAEPTNHGVMAQRLRDEGWHVGSLLGAMPDTTFSTPPKR